MLSRLPSLPKVSANILKKFVVSVPILSPVSALNFATRMNKVRDNPNRPTSGSRNADRNPSTTPATDTLAALTIGAGTASLRILFNISNRFAVPAPVAFNSSR